MICLKCGIKRCVYLQYNDERWPWACSEKMILFRKQITLWGLKKRGLIGVTRPTLFFTLLHIFINFSKTKKGFFSLSFPVTHVCSSGYHQCLRLYFQTSNQKSVPKNKWLNSFKKWNKTSEGYQSSNRSNMREKLVEIWTCILVRIVTNLSLKSLLSRIW